MLAALLLACLGAAPDSVRAAQGSPHLAPQSPVTTERTPPTATGSPQAAPELRGTPPQSPPATAESPLTTAARRAARPLAGQQVDFSPATSNDLELFRAALRSTADDVLATQAPSATAPTLSAALLASLAAQGVQPPADEPTPDAEPATHPLATFTGVDVEVPTTHPTLRVVSLHLGVHDCGTDTMLRVYRHDGQAWRPVLTDHAGRFANIATGALGLQWAMTPAASDGAFLVLVAAQNPWCQSSWQDLRWRVYRLRDDGTPAGLVDHGHGSAFTNLGEGYEVTARADAVRLTATVSLDFEPGMTRQRLLEWRLSRGGVTTETLAEEPLGFFNEWTLAPWRQASRWTLPSAKHAERWHQQLAGEGLRACTAGVAGVCEGTPARTLLRLECPTAPRSYVTVTAHGGNRFRLDDFTPRAPAGCRVK